MAISYAQFFLEFNRKQWKDNFNKGIHSKINYNRQKENE